MARILVVDDDRTTQIKLRGILNKAGYEVLLASDGKEAMKQIDDEKPDLMVLDIYMPDQDGIETMLKLAREDNNLPIISISGGGAGGSFLDVTESLGAVAALKKPIDKDALLTTIAETLQTIA